MPVRYTIQPETPANLTAPLPIPTGNHRHCHLQRQNVLAFLVSSEIKLGTMLLWYL